MLYSNNGMFAIHLVGRKIGLEYHQGDTTYVDIKEGSSAQLHLCSSTGYHDGLALVQKDLEILGSHYISPMGEMSIPLGIVTGRFSLVVTFQYLLPGSPSRPNSFQYSQHIGGQVQKSWWRHDPSRRPVELRVVNDRAQYRSIQQEIARANSGYVNAVAVSKHRDLVSSFNW